MNIVLTGFMGTGKSAVGRHLADQLHIPFIDMDVVISKKARLSVSDIFKTKGEAAFRTLEREAVLELSGMDKTVIATGGGVLLDPKNREHLQMNGILVCLTAKMGTLLERLKEDPTRPLVSGENLEQNVDRLMKERQSIYNSCPIQIDTENKSIAQVSAEIIKEVSSQWQA
jgi:shikimate kinase